MTAHPNHVAQASAYLIAASELAQQGYEWNKDKSVHAQILATMAVAESVLALARQLYDQGGGDVPLVGTITPERR
jgi:hypothetical protein